MNKTYYSKQNDNALVELFILGDNRAFDYLFNRHMAEVRDLVSFLSKDDALRDDICQMAFIKAMEAMKNNMYKESNNFRAWVKQIARNLIYDHLRSARVKKTSILGKCATDVSEDSENFGNGGAFDMMDTSMEDILEKEAQLQKMEMLIKKLPKDQREVVEMRLSDVDFKDIAEKFGVSINTALGRMNYAKKNLHKMMTAA